MSITNARSNRRGSITLVQLLNWTYHDQRAHTMSHVPFSVTEAHLDTGIQSLFYKNGCEKLLQNRLLGRHIPTTDHKQRRVLHPDADAVHLQVIELSRADPFGALLIFQYASRGMIPDYSDDIPIPQPIYFRQNEGLDRGREKIVQNVHRVGDGHLERKWIIDPTTGRRRLAWVEVGYPYCPLTYWPSISSVTESRRFYRLWFNALNQVWPTLPKLQKWYLDEIGAVAKPWGWDNDNDTVGHL
jgi:hypothetical protein